MSRIAIMQPYFVPYAGYFRLISEVDLFVIYDCVQFPRRGYVHRNRLPDATGAPRWFTLPLSQAPQATAIKDMRFATDATSRFASLRQRFPDLGELPPEWETLFARMEGSLLPWLHTSLELCCRCLNIERPMIRSSTLNISSDIRGQNRIIAICKALNASAYLNAPGGRTLYDVETFRQDGISLEFLPPFEGASWSVLHDIAKDWRSGQAS